MFPAEPLLAITSHPPGPVTTPPGSWLRLGARIMPGLAGQILNYRGVKIVTGADFDNFVFITYELFLHTLVIFIDAEQFGQARYLIATDFYLGQSHRFGNEPMVGSNSIDDQLRSLGYRNDRLKLRRESVKADPLRDRSKSGAVRFESLAQADVILYLYFKRNSDRWWYPQTTAFLAMNYSALPVFARASSKKYFNRLRVLLGFDTADQMREWIREMESGKALPKSGFHRLPLGWLTAAKQLATKE
jgi:hypothetical protein